MGAVIQRPGNGFMKSFKWCKISATWEWVPCLYDLTVIETIRSYVRFAGWEVQFIIVTSSRCVEAWYEKVTHFGHNSQQGNRRQHTSSPLLVQKTYSSLQTVACVRTFSKWSEIYGSSCENMTWSTKCITHCTVVRIGPSHGYATDNTYRKFPEIYNGHVVFVIRERTDRQTDIQTRSLPILRTATGGEV